MDFEYDAASQAEATIVMTRIFDAPRAKMWAALTTPEHVKRWYGGDGFTNPVCEMDVREGGLWHHVMRTPDGHDIALDMVYVTVDPPKKLVWRHVDFGKGTGALPYSENTVTLEDLGEKTGWRMVARFASFDDRARAQAMGFAETVGRGCAKVEAVAKAI